VRAPVEVDAFRAMQLVRMLDAAAETMARSPGESSVLIGRSMVRATVK
jgi:hypothetical protein